MDINRNQWFLAGMVLLFLGIQFRAIESVVLTPEFTEFLDQRTAGNVAVAAQTVQAVVAAQPDLSPKTIRPPDSLGWALLSIGAVLVLHSLSMKRPD